MATLAADVKRVFEAGYEPCFNEIPVIEADIIFEGAAVGESSSDGTARPLEAGDVFLGFAARRVDNSAGAAADKKVLVRQRGVVALTVTNGDNVNDLGATVYASDDNTFTLASTSNTAIGKVIRFDGTQCLVYFEAAALRSI